MNFHENVCSFVIATLVSGLKFPHLTAIGVSYSLSGRQLYHRCYSNGNPKDRFNGNHGSFTYIIMTFLALYSVFIIMLQIEIFLHIYYHFHKYLIKSLCTNFLIYNLLLILLLSGRHVYNQSQFHFLQHKQVVRH